MKRRETPPACMLQQTLIVGKISAQSNISFKFCKFTDFHPQIMSLPLHKRYDIVFLHEHPRGPKLGTKSIAKIIECSKHTVTRWIDRWKETKDLSDEPKAGRSRVTTAKQDAKIVDLAKSDENATSYGIQQEMENRGVEISARTVRRRLHEAGGTYSKPLCKPLLTEKHQMQRLIWAKKHKKFDWNKVIFTDESTFYLNQPIRKTWNLPGKRKIVRTVKHPAKVHVWGCFSASGFGELVCFEKNLDAKFMCTIYEKGLLPSAEEL